MNNLAKQLTEKAFKKKQLDKLLLGEKPYKYIPKYSPAIDTDLALLIENGFYTLEERDLPDFSYDLSKALMKLANEYAGIVPVASIIMLEFTWKKRKSVPFNIRFATYSYTTKKYYFKIFPKVKER